MEKVLLGIVDFRKRDNWPPEEILKELQELVATSGGQVVDHVVCRCDKPTAGYLITSGKVEEIALKCQSQDVDTVVFSYDLKGNQQRNLEVPAQMGFHTYWHDDAKNDLASLRRQLKAWNVVME